MTTTAVDTLPVQGQTIGGKLYGGQQPISNVDVGLWAAGTTGYGSTGTLLARTRTDGAGGFTFKGTYTCPTANTPLYITGLGGNPGLVGNVNNTSIDLGVTLGACSLAASETVFVNELTTVALAYSMAQFFNPQIGAANPDVFGAPASNIAGLANANSYTSPTLVRIVSGQVNTSNSNVTVEGAKINSIANSLAACVNTTGSTSVTETVTTCGKLFAATTPPGSLTRPSDTLQAAVQMALYPYQNVTTIFNLSGPTPPYAGLTVAPHDLTIGVQYSSPSFALTVSNTVTTSNLAIDAAGKVWLPSTAPARLVEFDPVSETFTGYASANVTDPQVVSIDREGYVWVPDTNIAQAAGFLSTSPNTQQALGAGTGSIYGVSVGADDILSFPARLSPPFGTGNNSIYNLAAPVIVNRGVPAPIAGAPTFLPSFITRSTSTATNSYYLATHAGTTGYMEYSTNGNVFTNDAAHTYVGGGSGQLVQVNVGNNDVLMSTPLNNKICSFLVPCQAAGYNGLNAPQGIAIDGFGNAWVANSGNGSVSEFNLANIVGGVYTGTHTGFALHGAGNGATMPAPFGVAIDSSGNVWVSNQNVGGGGPFALSEIVGAAGPTVTPLYNQLVNKTIGTRP